VVAEDDGDVRAMTQSVLQDHGYDVASVVDGAMLIAELERGDFSLVVTDLLMPKMNGAKVIRRTRAANNATPFILATGSPTSFRTTSSRWAA
jgi:two-component system chemotaxis response regulator CheY